jgi:hypothetical protein
VLYHLNHSTSPRSTNQIHSIELILVPVPTTENLFLQFKDKSMAKRHLSNKQNAKQVQEGFFPNYRELSLSPPWQMLASSPPGALQATSTGSARRMRRSRPQPVLSAAFPPALSDQRKFLTLWPQFLSIHAVCLLLLKSLDISHLTELFSLS